MGEKMAKISKNDGLKQLKTVRFGTDKGVYTELTLRGVDFNVVSNAVAYKLGLTKKDLLPLDSRHGLYIFGTSREDMYRAAGYNVHKIDFAVPQSWLNQPEVHKRFYGGDRAVWSYEGKRNFAGKPIWDSEMKARLKKQVLARLKARKG